MREFQEDLFGGGQVLSPRPCYGLKKEKERTMNKQPEATHYPSQTTVKLRGCPVRGCGIFGRIPTPEEADRWWQDLVPAEKSVFHALIRCLQCATDAQAIDAVRDFYQLDAGLLKFARERTRQPVRSCRSQKRALRPAGTSSFGA